MHKELKRRFLSWADYENALTQLDANLDRGDGLEWLAKFYLEYFKVVYQLEESHFPRVDGNNFPTGWQQELGLGSRDLGIDGIYRRTDDQLVAVQVKFRSKQEKLLYKDLATFWSESENAHFRMVFTNAVEITDVATRRRGHLLVSREQLDLLDGDFWQGFYAFSNAVKIPERRRKEPRPYQTRALTDIVAGFQGASRGKLIAACGIGKTLIGLWAMEQMGAKNVLFLAPNLQLIRQTLNEWGSQTTEPFSYLAVCSDQSVSAELDGLSDALAGTDIPITTDPVEIAKFITLDPGRRKVIFSTYQSLPSIAHAVRITNTEGFDFALFDEAHKTAGIDTETGFGVGLRDEHIPIRKRLFLTATERLYSPRLQAAAAEQDRTVFSMDDPALYGHAFHRLSFSQAIAEGIISDYRVVVAVITGAQLRHIIQSSDLLLDTDADSQKAIRTNLAVNQVVLKKVFEETSANKLVSYHRSVKDATSFASEINESEVFSAMNVSAFSVNGTMSSSKRSQIIHNFEIAETGVLSNARCLVEGVDIPIIDGVFFASPKNSLIDIVQAVGRALRKPYGVDSDKVAAVVVPVVLDAESDQVDVRSSNFDRLYNVIQALRDQDEGIADHIDHLNLQVATSGSSGSRGLGSIIRLIVPAGVSILELEKALELRIAEVNGNQTGSVVSTSQLGSGQRVSGKDRRLRTIGDYTPAKYEASLVAPTVERFLDPDSALPRSAIKINNNNVGHCEKLGIIEALPQNNFRLSQLGKSYQMHEVSFDEVFTNQLLLYRERTASNSTAYPYRIFIEFMLGVKSVSYLDFLYGIYSTDVDQGGKFAVDSAVSRVEALRALQIRPGVANERTKAEIILRLEAATGLLLDFNDVWTDRTTTYNQFRYFRRHLELFSEVFVDEANVFKFKPQGEQLALNMLGLSLPFLGDSNYGQTKWLAP
jgi:superfamily II DNA or RNA helicase